MSAIPGLKKKLKSVRTTGKLSKAMKTVSAAKLSKLSSAFQCYTLYAEQYRRFCDDIGAPENSGQPADTNRPELSPIVIVCGSNRGFCGGFNHEVLRYLQETVLPSVSAYRLIVCGDEMIRLATGNGLVPEAVFTFDDVPAFADCVPLFDWLNEATRGMTDYPIRIVYPAYKNTLTQTPSEQHLILHPTKWNGEPDNRLWIPDYDTVMQLVPDIQFRTLLYGWVLETALGAQAATLMTMRTAYDTATEYTAELEGEIHRQRQREVTADVIETASERGNKGDDTNG